MTNNLEFDNMENTFEMEFEGVQVTDAGAFTPLFPGIGTNSIVQRIDDENTGEKQAKVTGDIAAAFGAYHFIAAYCAFAANYNNTVNGKYSFACNHKNEITEGGDSAFVGGFRNKANKSAQFIHGIGNEGYDAYQAIFGKYCLPRLAALIIGNGKNEDSRSNAFVVDWNGLVEMGTSLKMGKTYLTENRLKELLGLEGEIQSLREELAAMLKEWIVWAGAENSALFDFRLSYGKNGDFATNANLATVAKEYNEVTNPNWKVSSVSGTAYASYQWLKYRATTAEDYIAITVKLPEASGKYTAKLTYRGLYGAPSAILYALPADTADIAEALKGALPVGTVELRKDDKSGANYLTDSVGTVCISPTEAGKEKIFVIKANKPLTDAAEIGAGGVGAYGFYFKALTLDGTAIEEGE